MRGRGSILARRKRERRDDDVCLWTISEAARATGLSRDKIRQAIELWERSRGAFGLAFVRTGESNRPHIRKIKVMEWIVEMERSASGR